MAQTRSRRRPVSSDRRFRKSPPNADYGTPERWQHSGRALELTERAGVLAARATEEHILDVMVLRRLLSEAQSAAGFRFKLDYQRAGLGAHVTGSYNPMGGMKDYFFSGRERSDSEEAAYRRWRNAAREIGCLSDVVVSVVCHDLSPARRDIARLQKGLDKLIDWYGLPKDGSGAAARI